MIPTLATERLTLRAPVVEDAVRMAEILNNFAVSGNLSRVIHPYGLADAVAFLSGLPAVSEPEKTNFSIDLGEHGYIGMVGFHISHAGPTLGYYLGQPYWGRGLMTEAARAAVAWFFEVTGHDRLHSGIFSFNKASLAVQRKLGFVETGRSLMHCLARNEEVRHIDTELSRMAWNGLLK